MKFKYFKIKEAFSEAKESFNHGTNTEKLTNTAKLFGKSAANVGMFATEIGLDTLKNFPERYGKVAENTLKNNSERMTPEQIEKTTRAVEIGKEARAKRLQKEREERDKQRRN